VKLPLLGTLSLACAAALSAPARAFDDCECAGTPGYVLDMPETVGIGKSFLTCLQAPPDSYAFILIGADGGPLQTKYGPLCVGFPFLTVWFTVVPATGELCLDHLVECDPSVIGFTGHFQFVALDPHSGDVGLSNSQCLTAIDTGACISEGDFWSFSQGALGGKCNGNNPACLRDQYFDAVFPNDLVLGDQDGDDADGLYALVLTSSLAVQNFLPSGSTSAALTGDEVDPLTTSSGNLGGQLAAARINVAFDDFGAYDGLKNQLAHKLGDMVFADCVHPALQGKTCRDVLALADTAISGEIAEPFDVDGDLVGDITFGDLNTAVELININFDNGSQNLGCLNYP